MAGDWMQIDCDLPEKLEVINIAHESGVDIDTVIGRIVRFWRWVERHFNGPTLESANVRTVSALCGGDENFWRAVEKEKWILFGDNSVSIPGYKKRFSKSAKRRALDAKRKSAKRRQQDDRKRTTCGAKEEQEKNRKEAIARPALPSIDAGMLADTGRLLEWLKSRPKLNGQRFRDSERERLFVVGAAEKACEKGDNPVGLFIDIVGNRRYDWISDAQEDRARKRIREMSASPTSVGLVNQWKGRESE